MTVTEDLALEAARAAERALAAGTAHGPLHGVPVAVTDVVGIEGVRCTRGSAAYRDDVAERDDRLVARLKAAGLIILGTLNVGELGLTAHTENRIAPPTRNPWSPRHSPGGASGGAGAAVAARLVPLAHGADAVVTAAACGIVGLEPTRGHAALARNARDASALLATLTGRRGRPRSRPPAAADRRVRRHGLRRHRDAARPGRPQGRAAAVHARRRRHPRVRADAVHVRREPADRRRGRAAAAHAPPARAGPQPERDRAAHGADHVRRPRRDLLPPRRAAHARAGEAARAARRAADASRTPRRSRPTRRSTRSRTCRRWRCRPASTTNGLPLGMLLGARAGEEATLVTLAAELETATRRVRRARRRRARTSG